jgi:hypothetical protein
MAFVSVHGDRRVLIKGEMKVRSNENGLHFTRETNPERKKSIDWARFRAHLLNIYESESKGHLIQKDEDIDEPEMIKFGGQLLCIRQKAKNKIEDIKKKIPEDHPVRCPIGLFSVMDYGRLETAQTRALAWFIDPDSKHGFKKSVAKTFIPLVTGRNDDFEIFNVYSELPLFSKEDGASGRSDVWIEGWWLDKSEQSEKQFVILVEAKVDSKLGDRQLRRYEYHLKKKHKCHDIYRVFLTPNGRQAEGCEEVWKPISFLELAKQLITASEEVKDTPGYHLLRYYISGILHEIIEIPYDFDQGSIYDVLFKLEALLQKKGAER